MSSRKRTVLCLLLHAAVILGECLGTALSIVEYRRSLFSFYTCDSNFLLLAASAAAAVCCVRRLRSGRPLPRRLLLFRYCATCAASLTFLTVLLILAPLAGPGAFPRLLLKGSLKYMHLLCPVLGLLAFLFAEDHSHLRLRHTLYAMIPTVLYAAVIVTLNLTRTVRGPYPFLLVYEQPVWASLLWAALILGTAWLIALALVLAKRGRRDPPPPSV